MSDQESTLEGDRPDADVSAAPVDGGGGVKPKRQVSTVDFPYYSLESCIEIIATLHGKVGKSSARPDSLAAWLSSTVTSGTYKLRVSASRMFGLIGGERGALQITELAERILDPATAAEGRAQAFLNVELYRKVNAANRGRLLPKAAGLEAEMVALGVAPNQKERARQVFERSAREAGFFDHGTDRLVEPTFNGAATQAMIPEAPEDKPEPMKRPVVKREQEGDAVADDPLVQGLLNRMPPASKGWPPAERARWLQAFAMNLSLIYGDQGEEAVAPNTADAR